MRADNWQYRGQRRPPFAIEPDDGQESVWDYPRPPSIRLDNRRIEVRSGDRLIIATNNALKVAETGSPPTFYVPMAELRIDLYPSVRRTFCEWKGKATYLSLREPDSAAVEDCAWTYERPREPFAALANHVAFYPGRVACWIDGERVRAQAGGYYGGWITNEVVGPFKGEAGTKHW